VYACPNIFLLPKVLLSVVRNAGGREIIPIVSTLKDVLSTRRLWGMWPDRAGDSLSSMTRLITFVIEVIASCKSHGYGLLVY
jgi:hypothetical protein